MTNERLSLRKFKKIYFWDIGLRNALINNFNPTNLRTDTGHIFENYIISEFLKNNYNAMEFKKFYFWRSYIGEEIDLLVEENGTLKGYEIKLNSNKNILKRGPLSPVPEVEVINSLNYKNFLSIS